MVVSQSQCCLGYTPELWFKVSCPPPSSSLTAGRVAEHVYNLAASAAEPVDPGEGQVPVVQVEPGVRPVTAWRATFIALNCVANFFVNLLCTFSN